MYTPPGYGTLFPYMIVDDADDFVSFLTGVFGAEILGTTELPDGRVANIRVRIGASAFMISESAEGGMPAMPGTWYVYVEDVDRTYDRAIDNGAIGIFPPTDMPYRDRQAGVADSSGNHWWISRRLVEEPYD